MSRRFTPKIVTANRLREGDVVYLTADDRWSALHHEAELIEDEAHGQLRLLHAIAPVSYTHLTLPTNREV